MTGELLVNENDSVLVLTINRPDQRNAMTLALAEAIAESLDMLEERADLAVGILTGSGRDFCAGMDLKRFSAGERPYVPGYGFGGITERTTTKPLIAAVEGWALGGGFEIVLACDLVVASERARFGLPEVKRGLVARGGGLFRLPQRIPRAIALEALFTGDPIVAAVAAQHGLINRVVPDGRALQEAQDLAARIAANAPLAVRASKKIALESADWPSHECFGRQLSETDMVFASRDAQEGAKAFIEKRSPAWTGQ